MTGTHFETSFLQPPYHHRHITTTITECCNHHITFCNHPITTTILQFGNLSCNMVVAAFSSGARVGRVEDESEYSGGPISIRIQEPLPMDMVVAAFSSGGRVGRGPMSTRTLRFNLARYPGRDFCVENSRCSPGSHTGLSAVVPTQQ